MKPSNADDDDRVYITSERKHSFMILFAYAFQRN